MLRITGLVLAAATVTASCGPPEPVEVIYRVTGTTTAADMTMTNATGDLEQGRFRVPFELRQRVEADTFVSISAQNPPDGDVLRCEILFDGQVVASARSHGPHSIVRCSERTG